MPTSERVAPMVADRDSQKASAAAGTAAGTATGTAIGQDQRRARRLWHRARRGARNWGESQGGATAVEFAFVAPVLIMIVTGIIQFGAIFFLQGNMANAAREAARALAVGSIASSSETETFVDQKLINWGVTFNVAASFPDPDDPADTDYTVVITAPLSEAAIFDYLGVFEGGTLRASASMRGET